MNFDFAEQINPDLEKLDFDNALKIAEFELQKIPTADFHSVLGKSLIAQAGDLSEWVEGFFNIAVKKNKIEALYFEMNEFDINTDLWYIDSFAYSLDGGLDLNDMEWLCNFDTESQAEIQTVFKIDGYEELQKAFETIELTTSDLQNARDWCEQIVILRFMELMRRAHLIAKRSNLNWARVPIYFTEHSYDFIVKSKN
jgi:hypothetical protein